ncbi:hypothetical protein P5673_027445 [Acropora cervicornis]|uniref:Uncharacterized protein n=1 Tax=Acropora cervicornis TaxID=6130 RepID=A0AAD9PYT5_ACRCE|nr:hypothetical protein P5673_027445 [Acropora cervicornis]
MNKLEAFDDASSSGYEVVVYLVIKSGISTQVRLIASKTRKENPADLASRGVNLLSLGSSALWWSGPTWISSQEEVREVEDVSEMITPPPESVKEMKVQTTRDLEESASLLVANTPELGIAHIINCEDYSDFSKLCIVTAYVIRFVKNIKIMYVRKEPESVTEDVASVKEGNPEGDQDRKPSRPWRQAARAGEERRRLPTNC